MANTIRSGAYETRVRIDTFAGLFQDGDQINVDVSYATEAINVDTKGGVLATVARHVTLPPQLAQPIGTLAYLYRRWGADPGAEYLMIAASGGQLYWMTPTASAWTPVPMADGFDRYSTDTWSWATYEINEAGADPIDVLLLSNAVDGLIMLRGDTLTASWIRTPKKFGIISRYSERIWGGAIDDDPDMLAYSAPFDPTDWTLNSQHPADGAGDVQQPTWDGDSFQTLVQLGSQLIAFKKRIAFRIVGATPDEYVFKEQFGGGAEFPRTVVVDGSRILMLGRQGLLQYDGMDTAPYRPQFAQQVFDRMNQDALEGACACLFRHRYYCALPLDGSLVNNAVLMHDTLEGTWLLYEGMTVADFLPTDSHLYFTSAANPGQINRWGDAEGAAMPMRWVSPWFDFGRMDMTKGTYTLYLTLDCKTEVTLSLTIQTEKKQKKKTVRFSPPAGIKGPKQRRVRFGGSGRRWRFIIQYEGTAMWRMIGGMQINVETDED